VRIVLHLGLPKTASSSLQNDLFPSLGEPVYFAGHSASGGLELPPLASLRAVLDRPSQVSRLAGRFWESIERVPSGTTHVLISDEMFVVDTAKTTWQKKLELLGTVLDDSSVTVVVVVREPLDWAYSLYAELSAMMIRQGLALDDFLLHSNQTELADYVYLEELLGKNFRKASVQFHSFDDLTSPEGPARLLGRLGIALDRDLSLSHRNRRQRSEGGYLSKTATLRTVLAAPAFSVWLRQRISRRWYSWAASAAEKITMTAPVVIPYPDEATRRAFYESRGRTLPGFLASHDMTLQRRLGQ